MKLTTDGHRNAEVRVDLLDRQERLLGTLDGVTGGMVEMSNAATVKSSGTVTLGDVSDEPWLQRRLRPVLIIDGIEYPLGVFIPATPTIEYSDAGAYVNVEMLDKLTILDRHLLADAFSVSAGTDPIQVVQDLIELAGESASVLEDTSERMRGDAVWEPGTSALQVINDLMDSINYFSLWCDTSGNYRATPYVAPASRGIVHTFRDDYTSIHTADFTREQDVYSIPNRFIVISTADGENPALVGVAENADPDSDYSIPNVGVRGELEEDVELASQAAADAYAERRLLDMSTATATVELTHAYTDLLLNDAVMLDDSSGVRGVHLVQRMDIPLSETELMVTTLREVAGV